MRRDDARRDRGGVEDALRRLQESESQLRFVTEHSADIILRLDHQLRILFVSPSCRRYGYEPDEIIGHSGHEFIHPDDRPRARARIADLFSDAPLDQGRDRSYRFVTKAGDCVWMETSPTIIRDEGGHPIELVSVHRDISERKAAADAIADSERRYRMLADNAKDVIVSYDMQGVIEFVSPSIKQFGYKPESLMGRKMSDLVQPDERERDEAFFLALREGRPLPTGKDNVWRTHRADGEALWLEGTPSPIVNDSGRAIGAVTVLRDVTSRKALEEELLRKSAEAEAAAVAKSQFLANMSHEIRNPLTVIVGYGELLEKLAELPARARTYISRVNTGARALLAIVDDVLDFSRMEAGKIELDPQTFELSGFLKETVDQFLAPAAGKGLDLRILHREDPPAIVRADRRRLQQVLSNLIGNALKFTKSGSVSVAVRYPPGPNPQLRFEVTDTGIGIPAQDAGRLFERFSQMDASNTRRAGGSGLGLAIAKGLVEMMGGEIGVDSRPGVGSTFWFTIETQAEARDAPETLPSATWDVGPLSILMVEDVAVNCELVSEMLAPYQIRVTGAADGVEAVETALTTRFDLILMDLQMPRLDGLAATRAIRADSPLNRDTPILALSANVFQPQVEACFTAGMNDFIRKPIDVAELLAKIAHWTRRAEAAGEASRGDVEPPERG